MKLLRWAVGGAVGSAAGGAAYVIDKYSIGKKAKGEDVFVTPEKEVEKLTGENDGAAAADTKPKRFSFLSGKRAES